MFMPVAFCVEYSDDAVLNSTPLSLNRMPAFPAMSMMAAATSLSFSQRPTGWL